MSKTFKVGDEFTLTDLAIRRSWDVTKGRAYAVEQIDQDGDLWFRDDKGDRQCVRPARARLVTPEPPVYEHDGRQYVETGRSVTGPGRLDPWLNEGDLVIVASPLPEPTVMVELSRADAEYWSDGTTEGFTGRLVMACRAALAAEKD